MAYVTRKLSFTTSDAEMALLVDKRRRYSTIMRCAYSYAFKNNYSVMNKETRADVIRYTKQLFPTSNGLDVSFLEIAVAEGMQHAMSEIARKIYLDEHYTKHQKSKKAYEPEKFVYKPRIFGTRELFEKRQSGEITHEEFAIARLAPIPFDGRANENGNRKADFDLPNNEINIKFSKAEHVNLNLIFHPNYINEFNILQEMIDRNLIAVSWNICKNNEIHLSYDIAKVKLYERRKNQSIYTSSVHDLVDYTAGYKSRPTMYAGLDANPAELAYSIWDAASNQIIFSDYYNFETLVNKKYVGTPQDKEKAANYLNTHLEKIAIAIVNELIHYQVYQFHPEKLNFKQGDQGKGSKFNAIMSNWPYGRFLELLKKHCENAGIIFKPVLADYSSFIGNINYGFPDPVAASCELARRGYYTDQRYPEIPDVSALANLWKEEPLHSDIKLCTSWKNLYQVFNKKSGQIYRHKLKDKSGFVEANSYKSGVLRMPTQHTKQTKYTELV
jgi:IS605 OrfB family transposase